MDILEEPNVLGTTNLIGSKVSLKETYENEKVSTCSSECSDTGNTSKDTNTSCINIPVNCDMANIAQKVINITMVNSNTSTLSENLGLFQEGHSKDIDSDLEVDTELPRRQKQHISKQVQKSTVKSLKGISKKHYRTVLDSDSESESDKGITTNVTMENEFKHFKFSNKKIPTVPDFDSDSDDIPHSTNFSTTANEPWYEPTTLCSLINDDKSESTNTIQKCVSSASKNIKMQDEYDKISIKASRIDCYSESDNSAQKSRLALLCDSESDEEPSNDQLNSPHISEKDSVKQSQHARKVDPKSKIPWFSKNTAQLRKMSETKNSGAEVTKKLTAKEAAELRKTIQSESQRMVREKNISLPYHKPKAHSLKEFLARRPRLAVAVPTLPEPPSVAIKMSTEQLELISKKLTEREKEVKEFYKSESESENDGEDDYVPPTIDTGNEEQTKKMDIIKTAPNPHDHINDVAGVVDSESNSNDPVEAVTKKDNKNHKKIYVEPEDGLQKNEDLQKAIRNSVDAKEINRVETEESNETKDVLEKDEYKCGTDKYEKETELGTSAENDIVFRGSTENYDFQLEDENTEKIVSLNVLNINQGLTVKDNIETSVPETRLKLSSQRELPSRPFTYTDLDVEILNFGKLDNRQAITEENLNDEPISQPVKSKIDIFKQRLSNIKPKLSGTPDKGIDLNYSVIKPQEVVELMEKFTKHMTSKKHHSKHKVKLSIVAVESGGDIRKETVAVNVDSDNDAEVHEEKPGAKLQKLREELQKQMDQKKSDIWQQKAAKGIRGCKTSKDGEDNKKDYDDNVYYDEEEEEEAEMTDEEEAEMTEEEEWENDVDLSDKPIRKSSFLDQEAEDSLEDTLPKYDYEDGTLKTEGLEYSQVKDDDKNDDSNMINKPSESKNGWSTGKKKVLKRIIIPDDDSDEEDLFSNCVTQETTPNEKLDSTVTADEDDIPPHQTRQLQTPMRQAVSQAKSISDFLTPISFITSIQSLASATKGSSHVPVTQTEELLTDLGKDNEKVFLQETQLQNSYIPPSTQDLMGICSGEFTEVTQIEPSNEMGKLIEFAGSQTVEHNNLGTDQDMIISQLLDEEELENFKKKFDSPLNPITQRSISDETQEITGGEIIDSDDEVKEKCGLRKKINQRIQFSDDDSSDEEKNGNEEEEIDLQDKDTDEEINIEYDSEENEIDLNSIGKMGKMKMSDFFEAEAELSESEWGSEDEDENDMDKLEFELGDTEKFDEDQVKEDLEKIHLRRMLDDDAREVKLFQEVFLEDGEMHGTGRQRQFKWNNIGLNGDQIEEKKSDDEMYLDEEENEEHWRKKRHEREMFLQEKQHEKLEDHDLLQSQILKIGQKVLEKSQNQNSFQNNTTTGKSNDMPSSHISNISFSVLSKRGSFLSRGDLVLKRVAEYTRTTTDVSPTSAKTTKNFVFQSISASEELMPIEDKKRKASDGTPSVLKKLRLNTNLSPAIKKPERATKF